MRESAWCTIPVILHGCVALPHLAEGSSGFKHVIAKLESDWKHLLDVPIIIDCPIFENY
jgi:hypothetical protein